MISGYSEKASSKENTGFIRGVLSSGLKFFTYGYIDAELLIFYVLHVLVNSFQINKIKKISGVEVTK